LLSIASAGGCSARLSNWLIGLSTTITMIEG
jgi:hypothetical protein